MRYALLWFNFIDDDDEDDEDYNPEDEEEDEGPRDEEEGHESDSATSASVNGHDSADPGEACRESDAYDSDAYDSDGENETISEPESRANAADEQLVGEEFAAAAGGQRQRRRRLKTS